MLRPFVISRYKAKGLPSTQSSPYTHTLYPVPYKIREHCQSIHAVIMQVLTAYGEQRDLAHEFLILTASISSIEEIEVFYIRRKLDDAAQLALGGGSFLIAHVYPHSIVSQSFIHDASVFIAAVIALSTHHMGMMLLQLANDRRTGHGLISIIKYHVRYVHVLTIDIGNRHTEAVPAAPGSVHDRKLSGRLSIWECTIIISQLISREQQPLTDVGITHVLCHPCAKI